MIKMMIKIKIKDNNKKMMVINKHNKKAIKMMMIKRGVLINKNNLYGNRIIRNCR